MGQVSNQRNGNMLLVGLYALPTLVAILDNFFSRTRETECTLKDTERATVMKSEIDKIQKVFSAALKFRRPNFRLARVNIILE